MPVTAVALQISLAPSASEAEALEVLEAYRPLLPALATEFLRLTK